MLDSVLTSGGGIAFRPRKYTYDAERGNLAGIRFGSSGATTTSLGVNKDGLPSSTTMPGGDQRSAQYYPLHGTTQISSTGSYASAVTQSAGFDPAGRLSQLIYSTGMTGRRFTYDGLGRLTSDSNITNTTQPPPECDGNPPPIVTENGNSCAVQQMEHRTTKVRSPHGQVAGDAAIAGAGWSHWGLSSGGKPEGVGPYPDHRVGAGRHQRF